jgi:uncharacterized protein with PQ loop repeat
MLNQLAATAGIDVRPRHAQPRISRVVLATLAILVTLVLWMPDVYILYRGQPADAVAVLFVMHLAIALVTYNLLVRLAPTGPVPRQASDEPWVVFDADAR